MDRFDVLISKIILKKIKKHHFDAFQHKRYFEKQPQPHFHIGWKPNTNLIYNLGLKHTLPKKKKNSLKKKKKKPLDITHGLDKPSPTQVLPINCKTLEYI